MIKVTRIGDQTYAVDVEGPPATIHKVHLSREYFRKLTAGQVSEEALILRSFEFLLERESSTSILREFDLPVIRRYFPEYEDEIKERFA